MHSSIRVGLVGDRNEQQKAQQAIEAALSAAGVDAAWVSTETAGTGEALAGCDGLWCVPGMPYRSTAGALAAIQFARANRVPFLGTSAGFQYALIEFARNVLGFADADHQKTNPSAAMPLISPLGCALLGVKARVHFTSGTV